MSSIVTLTMQQFKQASAWLYGLLHPVVCVPRCANTHTVCGEATITYEHLCPGNCTQAMGAVLGNIRFQAHASARLLRCTECVLG